jgi:hypothetical protein
MNSRFSAGTPGRCWCGAASFSAHSCPLGGEHLRRLDCSILNRGGIYVGLRMEIVPEPVELVSRVEHDPTTGGKEILLDRKVITTSWIQSVGIVI